jgi:23S rRNA pseudouridine1911/1915/1917 synthase
MNECDDIRFFSAAEGDGGKRLDLFLAGASGLSRTKIHRLIGEGRVTLNDLTALKPSQPVQAGDEAVLEVPPAGEPGFTAEDIPLDIVYEDSRLIVVDKPAGMVVHPGCGVSSGTLASALLFHFRALSIRGGAKRPGIVHRLDRDTSGLLVAALDDETHERLSAMMSEHAVKRVYTAVVWGHPRQESGVIDAPIGRHPRIRTLMAVVPGGRPATTYYETTASHRFLSLLRVTLGTGRTHQIRVHLAHLGHPVFGDPDYGGREELLKGFDPDIRVRARRLLGDMPRQALHAGHLEFDHPFTGEHLSFDALPPEDMQRLLLELERETAP